MKTLQELLDSETPTIEDVKKLLELFPKDVLKFDPTSQIALIWSIEDVKMEAQELDTNLTDDEAFAVLCDLKDNHDSEVGINWEVVRNFIHYRD